MKRFYSQATGATYLSGIHKVMPDDVIELSEQIFLAVIGNPAPGKIRGHDASGLPILIDPPGPTPESLAELERQWRDGELSGVLWLRERHRDQLEIEGPTTLSPEQFNELLVYMQALRDWPQSPDFPESPHRPKAPDWIAEQAQ